MIGDVLEKINVSVCTHREETRREPVRGRAER